MDRLVMLGKRLICDDCGTKYYDLNRNPAVCPKCGCERIRKRSLKTAVSVPVNINVEDNELNKDDFDLDSLDDLDVSSDDDSDDGFDND
jgi:predicted  nucleic acid-binding Zn-ribbon protein